MSEEDQGLKRVAGQADRPDAECSEMAVNVRRKYKLQARN